MIIRCARFHNPALITVPRPLLSGEGVFSVKRVLMVAYHFPPHSGTSGVQRALRFSSHLPEFGWEPIVLTASSRVYDHVSPDLLGEIRDGAKVIRAPAADTRKHLSIGGRYPGFLARPDRWRWWWLGAVPAGWLAIRRYRPDVVWSTYPIATAHAIGLTLSKLSGLPLVADFRDPMAQDDYPPDPATWRSFERIERRTVSGASRSVFTTPGARELYRQRYPADSDRFRVIENGYDEGVFQNVVSPSKAINPGKVTLLHSGIVYPYERDPTQLFAALSMVKQTHPDLFASLTIRFRASSANELLSSLAREWKVESTIEILPAVPYAKAIAEMQAADGLLVLQASNCNAQIPAKIYECLRARRPLLVLTDPAGDTAGVARQAGIDSVVPLDEPEAIRDLVVAFLSGEVNGVSTDKAVSRASRYARTEELARVLGEAVNE